MSKIGIGIITCNRPKYLKRLIDSIPQNNNIDELIIINDGKEITDFDISHIAHINNEINKGEIYCIICQNKIQLTEIALYSINVDVTEQRTYMTTSPKKTDAEETILQQLRNNVNNNNQIYSKIVNIDIKNITEINIR